MSAVEDRARFLPMAAGAKAGTPPVFEKIAIVGLGLIGGSIAAAARQLWPSGLVIGVDAKDVLEKAMVLHAVDVAADDLVVAAEADLVILAAPARQNLELLASLPDYLPGPAVITDTGSTKRAIVDAARALPRRFTFVGGHPLGGAARSGIEHSRPDLFAGRPWLFTPDSDNTGEALERLYRFVGALGAVPRTLGVDEHDRLLAYVSQVPQLVVSALMHLVGETVREDGLGLAGRGLVDTTRLASSPGAVWSDICATNPAAIGRALDELIAILSNLRGRIGAGDVEELFASANRWRDVLVSATPDRR